MAATAQLDDLDLLTPQEAAEVLRLRTHRTMERWRTEGTGPSFVRIGRRVAYTRRALKTFVESNIRNTTSDDKS